MQRAVLREAQNWAALFQDPSYRGWVTNALLAGGGVAADIEPFLNLMLLARQRQAVLSSAEGGYPFVWLTNPVLLITGAKKFSGVKPQVGSASLDDSICDWQQALIT